MYCIDSCNSSNMLYFIDSCNSRNMMYCIYSCNSSNICIVFTVVIVVIHCIVITVVIVVIYCIVLTVVIHVIVIYCIVFTVVIVVIWCIKRRQTEVKTVVIQPKRRPQTVTAKPKPQTNGMILKILHHNYTMQIHMKRKLSRHTYTHVYMLFQYISS